MVGSGKRPSIDDPISNNEGPPPKKVKDNPAPKNKGKGKAKANDNAEPVIKKGQDRIDRRELVQHAYKTNPEHVMVIGPKGTHWHDLPSWVAGYLGFQGDLEPFRQFLLGNGQPALASQLTHQILENYNAIRNNAYGKPISTATEKAQIPNIAIRHIWAALTDNGYDMLFTNVVNLPLHKDWGFVEGSQDYAVAVNVATMSYLIHHNPHIFSTAHQAMNLRPHCVGKTNIPAEDWYRAYVLLCFYRRQTGTAKNKTGFLAKQKSAEARPIEYFTAQEVSDLEPQELDEAVDDADGRTTGDVMQELYATVASDEIPSTQVFEDVVKYAEFMEEKVTEWEVAVDTVAKASKRATNTLGSAGRSVKRVMMSKTQLRQACERLGATVKIKHDDPCMQDPVTAEKEILEQESEAVQEKTWRVQGLLSRGINEGEAGVENLIDGMTEREREHYWNTQSRLSTVSAVTPTYAEACDQLGYDREHPTPFPIEWQAREDARARQQAPEQDAADEAGEGSSQRPLAVDQVETIVQGPEVLELNGWQVTGVAWAINQEQSPMRGSLLADDCGTGKTVIMLSVILEGARRAVRDHAAGSTGPWKPTLIVTPPHVVDVWVDEVQRFFKSELPVWRYYETKDKVTNKGMKARTLPRSAAALASWLEVNCPADEPRTAATLIVTAYDTWTARTLRERATGISSVRPVSATLVDPATDDLDDITGDEEATIDPSKQYYSLVVGKFGRFVLDEAHKVRNPYTKCAEAIRQARTDGEDSEALSTTIIHMLTATPMMNRGNDFFGYLTLLWRDVFKAAIEESFGSFCFDVYKEEHMPQFTTAYQPEELLDYEQYQLPLWRLNPHLFSMAMDRRDDLGRCVRAFEVLRAVIPVVMLRRTQATVLEVNGIFIRIGDSIPPYTICTVELEWNDKQQWEQYKKLYDSYITYLTYGTQGDRGTVSFKVAGTNKTSKGNAGTRSFVIHRLLAIMTMNLGLHKVILRSGHRHMVQDVHKWQEMFQDKGMSHYFDLTKPERDLPLYADRYTFAVYLSKESPKLRYLAKLMGEICLSPIQPRRALIFADGPMTLWNIEGFLANLGFTVGALRSNLDSSERKELIDDFNNETTNMNALLLNLKSSNSGLNLHHHCSDIIILCCADNVNQILQIIGRVHRISQRQSQRIWIVTLDHSYDQLLQYNQTDKMLQQIAGEGDIQTSSHLDEVALAQELAQIEDETERLAREDQVRDRARLALDDEIRAQSNQIITALLGQRCPRDRWGDRDLTLKDQYEEQVATPARVRTRHIDVAPVPIALTAGSSPSKPAKSRSRRTRMSTAERLAQEKRVEELKKERRRIQQEDSKRMAAKREELNQAATKAYRHRKRLVELQRQQAREELAVQSVAQTALIQERALRIQKRQEKKGRLADKKYNLRGSKKGKDKAQEKSGGLSKEYVDEADMALDESAGTEDDTEIEQDGEEDS